MRKTWYTVDVKLSVRVKFIKNDGGIVMNVYKKIIAIIIVIIIVIVIPIPTSPMKDGGTRVYCALTYKVVEWHRFYGGDSDGEPKQYDKTSVYLFPNNFLSIDELWKIEMSQQ